MKDKRQKIAEIIIQTYKTPLEKADEILLLCGLIKQFNCGRARVFGEERCNIQCDDCLKEYED